MGNLEASEPGQDPEEEETQEQPEDVALPTHIEQIPPQLCMKSPPKAT